MFVMACRNTENVFDTFDFLLNLFQICFKLHIFLFDSITAAFQRLGSVLMFLLGILDQFFELSDFWVQIFLDLATGGLKVGFGLIKGNLEVLKIE